MAAGIYNFTIEQGATFTRQFRYKDANGDPIDLSDHNARMEIKDKIGGTRITGGFFSTGTDGLSITNTNLITLTISSTDTASFNFNTAVYDIEIFTGTTVIRLLQGKIKLSKEVTTTDS
jgi:hypothetical protein